MHNDEEKNMSKINTSNRLYAEPSTSPKIVAKMDSDPKTALDQNPYNEEEMKIQNQKVLSYFED
ncbi:hypothetical protein CIB95_08545 [Lottiidibacillus patelloidae]|uniref:Uncharacterized protein n=1 Tax=Lottiidibacillus patelloidae TaxID=2670334 RepID=A0A263BUR8_9BACI|nr:hypothetical protein [Lottiidibacillus patelloidae]OZM57493.1 hypothetical protein CIB95_08545 [Lottiidibacillus patelloidae]